MKNIYEVVTHSKPGLSIVETKMASVYLQDPTFLHMPAGPLSQRDLQQGNPCIIIDKHSAKGKPFKYVLYPNSTFIQALGEFPPTDAASYKAAIRMAKDAFTVKISAMAGHKT